MTQVIDSKQTILEKLDNLTPEQQDAILDFINFLEFKMQQELHKEQEKEPISSNTSGEKQEVSFYEATKEIAGYLDWRPGDLATNKKYLERMGE